MDSNWFEENKDKMEELLEQLHVDSKEDFDDFQAKLFRKLNDKPILSGEELMKLPAEPDNYIIDKFLWEEDVCILLASEKVGKSILGMQMACALTTGKDFLGHYKVKCPQKVLYVQAEGSRKETINRFRDMHKHIPWDEKKFFHMYPPALSLDTDEGHQDFVSKIIAEGVQPDIIIIDPLYMAMEGDLIDNKAARLFCRNVRKVKEQFNCTIVIIHHKRRLQKDKKGNIVDARDNDIMGSFVWKAFPSHILNMSERPDKLRTLTCETQRGGAVVKDMQLNLVQPSPLYFEIHNTPNHPPYYATVLQYFKDMKKELCAKDIEVGTELSTSAVSKSLRYYSNPDVNKIIKVNPGKHPTYYKLKRGKK